MTDKDANPAPPKTPIHLWIVAILSLLWNAMGAFDYLATQFKLESYMSKFTEVQLEYFYSIPSWAVAGWALAIWASVAGSIGLLLRHKWAHWAFIVAVVGMAVSTLYNFGLSNGIEVMGTEGVIFSVVIWIIALFLVGYSCKMVKNGVLR